MNNIVITIFVSLATSIAFNLYYYKINPPTHEVRYETAPLSHASSEEGLEGEVSASRVAIKEATIKVLPKTSVDMFYCSLAPNRYIAKFVNGKLSFWDLTTASFEESIQRTPDDSGSYELFQTYIKMTHGNGGETGIFKIHEVGADGKIVSFKELDIIFSVANCDF